MTNNNQDQKCYGATSGEGYSACDQHGCSDCVRLALDFEDYDQIDDWKEQRKEAKPEPSTLITVDIPGIGRVCLHNQDGTMSAFLNC